MLLSVPSYPPNDGFSSRRAEGLHIRYPIAHSVLVTVFFARSCLNYRLLCIQGKILVPSTLNIWNFTPFS